MALLAAVGSAPAPAQVTDKAAQAAIIESGCGLKKGTITITGEKVQFQPSPDEPYEHVECALARLEKAGLVSLPIGFVGNEADPNAVVRPQLRYIAEGPTARIAALERALQAEDWNIVRSATASDGSTILQFESGPKMTNGEAEKLLDRIWSKEFGDLEFGTAPRKLSEPASYDD